MNSLKRMMGNFNTPLNYLLLQWWFLSMQKLTIGAMRSIAIARGGIVSLIIMLTEKPNYYGNVQMAINGRQPLTG